MTKDRYLAAVHAMQTGVAHDGERSAANLEPKHLRVGINVALCDHAALVALLITKGVISEEEYLVAITDQMEVEVRRYEADVSDRLGFKVVLR